VTTHITPRLILCYFYFRCKQDWRTYNVDVCLLREDVSIALEGGHASTNTHRRKNLPVSSLSQTIQPKRHSEETCMHLLKPYLTYHTTERLKWRPMLRQMRESMLIQTLRVRVASEHQRFSLLICPNYDSRLLWDQTSCQMVRQTGCRYVNPYNACSVSFFVQRNRALSKCYVSRSIRHAYFCIVLVQSCFWIFNMF